MDSFFWNDMHCFTNVVHQSCLRDGVSCAIGLLPIARSLVERNGVKLGNIDRVALHQQPDGRGLVEYTLHLCCRDGSCYGVDFQGSGLELGHASFMLYDRRRDGKLEHLRLQH